MDARRSVSACTLRGPEKCAAAIVLLGRDENSVTGKQLKKILGKLLDARLRSGVDTHAAHHLDNNLGDRRAAIGHIGGG